MRNDTASPVSILAVAVTPPEPETGGPAWPPAGAWPPGLPDGVKVRPLDAGYRATTDLPHSDAAEILVEWVTLQSGMSMEFGSEAPRLLTVQKGILSVRCAAACPVRYRSPASTVTASPSPIASATGADRMTLLAGESVLIPANVHATITTEETGFSEPSSVLATTVIPSNKNPGKQGEH
jgi:hypothetical protein